MTPTVEDAVTRFWQRKWKWALVIMAVSGVGLFLLTELYTDWGRETRRVVVAQSVFFIFAVAIQGGALAFLLNGLGVS